MPGKFHGQRSVGGCRPWGHKRVEHDLTTMKFSQSLDDGKERREAERLAKKETNKPGIRVLTSAGSFARLGFINQGCEKEAIWLL